MEVVEIMIVTKKMLDPELQKRYWLMKLLAFIMTKLWAINLINRFGHRKNGIYIPGINCEERFITGKSGGHNIRVLIFRPLNMMGKLPGMLYIHGGGHLIGTPEFFLKVIKRFSDCTPCIIISPDYRKATEEPYPAAFNDCYDTLLWLNENSELLGVISDNIIVSGHSSGGGLTAAISLKASETKDVNIAFQMPIYPMIDDRQITQSAINNNAPAWNSLANKYAWHKYLKTLKENNLKIPPYAAAARSENYSELPPTITFVGDLDPLRDETIEYVENLKKNGIQVEFKLFKGCFHAFDILVPKSKISEDAWAFVLKAYKDYINKYIETKSEHAGVQICK